MDRLAQLEPDKHGVVRCAQVQEVGGGFGWVFVKRQDERVRQQFQAAAGRGFADDEARASERVSDQGGEQVARHLVFARDIQGAPRAPAGQDAVERGVDARQGEGIRDVGEVVFQRGQFRGVQLVEDVIHEMGQGRDRAFLHGIVDHAGQPKGAFHFDAFCRFDRARIREGRSFETADGVALLKSPHGRIEFGIDRFEFAAQE